MARTKSNGNKDTPANLGVELWLTVDKLRSNMDAADCKQVVLGLIFLIYSDPDQYKAENVIWLAAEARGSNLQAKAKQPSIGKLVGYAMVDIERNNPRLLKGVLPKDYARPALDEHRFIIQCNREEIEYVV